MGSTNFVKSLWLPDIQIYKCKQFKKRQIVTDVAGQFQRYQNITSVLVQFFYAQTALNSDATFKTQPHTCDKGLLPTILLWDV